MTVYIEYAILDNFLVDYLLLYLSAVLLKVKYKKLRLIFASAIGTAVAVVLPIISVPPVVAFLIKISLAAVMALVAVRYRRFIDYVKYLNAFLLSTFVLGGAVIAICSLVGIPYDVQAYYSNKMIPIGVNLLCGYLAFGFVKRLVKRVTTSVEIAADLYDVEIFINDYRFTAVALFDSGNRLTDGKTGLPVIVCGKRFFDKVVRVTKPVSAGKIAFTDVSGGGESNLYETDYIVVKSGSAGAVKHAELMVGNVKNVDADMIIGRTLTIF